MSSSIYSDEVKNALNVSEYLVDVGNLQIRKPFPSPIDWRDVWIYFLLVDRFNNPENAPVGNYPEDKYQGGNFAGIREKIPYLKEMGVGAVWLSPIQMNPQWFQNFFGGYAIEDLIGVEPRYCSNPDAAKRDPSIAKNELKSLVDEMHANGIYVIFDIVLNHMGDLFAYDGGEADKPWREHPYPINWRDENGEAVDSWSDCTNVEDSAGPWPRELRRNDFFRRRGTFKEPNIKYGDFPGGLKELVTDYYDPSDGTFPVRDILIKAYQYLIAEYDVDGYRIDTLMYVDRNFSRIFGNSIREYAHSIGKHNFFTFGEVWDDNNDEQIASFVGRDNSRDRDDLIGVDAAIDFPVRRRLVDIVKGRSAPVILAKWFKKRKFAHQNIVSSHAEAGKYFIEFLDNHDLKERFHYSPMPQQTTLALACLFTLQGIPCVYYGTEMGLAGRGGRPEAVRQAMWGISGCFNQNHQIYNTIKDLSELRHREPALKFGRQYFRELSGDGFNFGYSEYPSGVLCYSRILNSREIVVVANTNTIKSEELFVNVDRFLTPENGNVGVLWSNVHTHQEPNNPNYIGGRVAIKVRLKPMEVQIIAIRK